MFEDMEVNPIGVLFALVSGLLMWMMLNYWRLKGMSIGWPTRIALTLLMPVIAYFIIVSMSNRQ